MTKINSERHFELGFVVRGHSVALPVESGSNSANLRETRVSQESSFPEAYAVLRDAITAEAFPGCAFGLLMNGQIRLLDALGHFTYASKGSGNPIVHPEMLFDIASLTKVVATTSAAMLLYQRGLLDLDLPVGELLPGFVVGRDSSVLARKVTLRHLLAHNSGLTGYVPFFHTATTPFAVLRGCLELPIEAEPETRAEYSDPGFILLGKALETILQENLSSWVKREVFLPLAMTNTLYCPAPSLRAEIPPTEQDELFRQRVIQGEVQDEHAFLLKGAAGHAGLFSNVSDLLRFSQAILAPGESQLFEPETVALFATRQNPEGSSRALGWDTPSGESSSGQYFSGNSVGHLGYSGCSIWVDREAQLSVILLTNRTWPHRQSQLIRSVRPAFHDAIRKVL
jgi:serine-type D-Ala-D-Ala carboxypeptidase